MTTDAKAERRVLVTGAAGYIGRLVVERLARDRRAIATLVATDLRAVPEAERMPGVIYEAADITKDEVAALIEKHAIDSVVHLAAIVTPPGDSGRELAHKVDVQGTERLLRASVAHGVRQFVITSSGAAYGYHADNPPLLHEDDALRGNEIFAYAHHKRLVEEMLARYREEHPELGQLVLRPGTVIGPRTHNQITAIFERPVVLGLKEAETPFVFIWDEDVAAIIAEGVHGERRGIYNLAGDGVMTLREIAVAMGKPFVALPAKVVERGLEVMQAFGVAPYGPEQVCFLRYRPVLSGERLQRELGYRPKSSREAFETYRHAHV
ncbi:MAG: NAD-dependent epimerase/dehydratase family protein [Myxococcales bacterium]|nr:NAD-dependent epimerase/dehydratase family protein [Myxococcales bacterium]